MPLPADRLKLLNEYLPQKAGVIGSGSGLHFSNDI